MPPQRLSLPQVTLCCVDTRSPAEAVYALRQSMNKIDFGRVLYLGTPRAREMGVDLHGIELIEIDDITSIEAYSRFMLHGLGPYIQTSYVLVVQWDGFVTHPELWQDQFLDYDYIGAPWYKKNRPPEVGNGGFSLRTRRLIDALTLLPYEGNDPEDRAICVSWREQLERDHGMRFAPVEVAAEFGIEYGEWRAAFGFHGMHNFAHVMDATTLTDWLFNAPTELLRSKHVRNLVKELILTGRRVEARALVRRRSQMTGWNRDQILLYTRTFAP